MRILNCLVLFGLLWPANAQAQEDVAGDFTPSVYRVPAGDDVQYRLQELLIRAVPGDVIQLEAGRFKLKRQIDIVTDNITLRGAGSDKTVLVFSGQHSGGQGIEAKGNNFVAEGLAIEDTDGNGIKVLGADNVTLRDLRVEWTGPPAASNGAYGIYPVQCRNVLIENCRATGASDAGIYVGQCRQAVVRANHVERNVAGIEIENTIGADVHGNVVTDNAGGILVFDLPGLPLKAGRNTRVFQNEVVENNHPNFAAPGNTVASIPSGTGVMIMATDAVEVFENEIADNQTANVSVVSYSITSKKVNDKHFDQFPESIAIHDNRISGGGKKPSGKFGLLIAQVVGTPFPDILFDGMLNEDKFVDGQLPDELRLSIRNNGDATFANFNLKLINPISLLSGNVPVDRDLAAYDLPRRGLPPVELADHNNPQPNSHSAVAAYRSAPEKLSDWRLFVGNGSTQEPVDGVVPYDLNTPLFSDYTTKYRFMRVPAGSTIQYKAKGPLDFPDGTVIAKTFACPVNMSDASQGERLLETRIEYLRYGQWFGFSYLWNEAQTEATLVLGGSELEVSWIHHDGSQRVNRYEIPNANQCLSCHSRSQQYVPIGPVASNLNRDFAFADRTQNQLQYLADEHLLVGLPEVDDRPSMPSFDDPHTSSVADRARAWLHVNCAHCHSPQGTAGTSGLDLRITQSDTAKVGYWKSPVAAGDGTGGRPYDIVPGKPEQSILLYRIESEEPSIRMPNVARNLVPAEAVALIRQWIDEMPAED